MFKPNLTKAQLCDIIEGMSDLDVARFLYCQEMAGTYLAVGKFEDMLVSAMHMCDGLKVEKVLGSDKSRWERSLAKRALLQGSTLGSLIKILERHSVHEADIGYLRWIKDKRDYFVHRLFHAGAWPGDMDEGGCRFMTRRLIAMQPRLSRAERNIWSIFERAGLVELDRLEDGSLLATNVGIYELPERADEVDEDHS
jgi:hypothetical protein